LLRIGGKKTAAQLMSSLQTNFKDNQLLPKVMPTFCETSLYNNDTVIQRRKDFEMIRVRFENMKIVQN